MPASCANSATRSSSAARSPSAIQFPGCRRVAIDSAKEAAVYAFENDISLIISHTPPFFSVPLFVGGHIPVLSYDYGEPSADFFPDPARSYLLEVSYQKRAAAALTTAVATISQAVKDETLNYDATVLGLANSHLQVWSESFASAARPHPARQPLGGSLRGSHGLPVQRERARLQGSRQDRRDPARVPLPPSRARRETGVGAGRRRIGRRRRSRSSSSASRCSPTSPTNA